MSSSVKVGRGMCRRFLLISIGKEGDLSMKPPHASSRCNRKARAPTRALSEYSVNNNINKCMMHKKNYREPRLTNSTEL